MAPELLGIAFDNPAILLCAQILALFAAGYFSYAIYRQNRLARSWLFISMGMTLMGVSQCFQFFADYNVVPEMGPAIWVFYQFILPFFIIPLLLLGFKGAYDSYGPSSGTHVGRRKAGTGRRPNIPL